MSQWFITYGFADVADDLLIGAYPLDARDVQMLALNRVARVLNLAENEEYESGARAAVVQALSAAGIDETQLSMTDFGRLPADAFERAVETVNGWLDEGKRTYIHCRAGWQRSAAVAAGVLAVRNGIDIDQALELVQARKPTADPLPHQREDLRRWWEARQTSSRT